MNEIIVHNLSNLSTAPVEAFHELQEDFKLYDQEKNAKLQMLIITRGFKYAFKAWQDETGKLWIIDAHQRKKALIALKSAGFNVPDLPYEQIYAKDKQEAVEEIAAYNSEFGTKNPTMKPVKLVAYTIENSSKQDDVVLDLFGGSGTSLIACEQTGRISYTMEMDPIFTDVIIRRYHNLNPEAKIIRIRNGDKQEIDNI